MLRLGKVQPSLDQHPGDYASINSNQLRDGTPDALSEMIDFVSSEKGYKILLEKKEGTKWIYTLNAEYLDTFVEYLRATAHVRLQWPVRIARILMNSELNTL